MSEDSVRINNKREYINIFRNVTPEEIGIPSKAIINFINELEDNNVNMHGFIMMKDNNIFCECYLKPFDKDFEHRMYSVGKSFTSIAIGLLQDEGKLNIDDKICSYFKDNLPKEGVHPYIEETTIKDMLMMMTPHYKTTYKINPKNDWVESFFYAKPSHKPGTIFSYDTSSTHVLSALVEKLSEKTLMDYLREKVLDYIGFSEESRFLKDPFGVSQGGSGLICTLRDLAKFSYVCMNDGKYNGNQLIPKEYLKEATSKKVDTSMQSSYDEKLGYGYQIWMSRYNGFTFYGIGGQLSICIPKYKIIFCTMADTLSQVKGVDMIHNSFWNNIYPFIENNYEDIINQDNKDYLNLKNIIKNLSH